MHLTGLERYINVLFLPWPSKVPVGFASANTEETLGVPSSTDEGDNSRTFLMVAVMTGVSQH